MSPVDRPALLGGTPIRSMPFAPYPRAFGGELDEVGQVLAGDRWLGGDVTRRFERELAGYLGGGHTVAVNTGGMALQLAFRALGIEPGDEILVRIDTCVADAFAAFNAGAVPVFADVDPQTFRLDFASAEETVGPRTRALVAVHMWGRPEDMDAAQAFAARYNLLLIDDACLALGAEWRGRKAGTFGHAGVFSFGWLKPFQAGGGGAIATAEEPLARELRALRAWGDLEEEFGARDQKELAWNGRLSDILAAVLSAQLKGYPAYLAELQRNAQALEYLLEGLPGIRPLPRDARVTAEAHTQFPLQVDESALGCSLDTLAAALEAEGVPGVWHAAFEPLTALTFFTSGRWRTWAVGHPDHARLERNYARPYPGAERLYRHAGIGLGRNVLASGEEGVRDTAAILARICAHAHALAAWEQS